MCPRTSLRYNMVGPFQICFLRACKNYSFVYTETQLWTFEPTSIPGVFYITSKASSNVITVPIGAGDSSLPTLEPKKSDYDSAQLWKFLPSSDGPNLMIQNYSLDGNGLVLDCDNGGIGKRCIMWSRIDNGNQKFYTTN